MKTKREKDLDAEILAFFDKRDSQILFVEVQGLIIVSRSVCISEHPNVTVWQNGKWLDGLDGNISFKTCVIEALNLLGHNEDLVYTRVWYEHYGLASKNESTLDEMETYRMEQNERNI